MPSVTGQPYQGPLLTHHWPKLNNVAKSSCRGGRAIKAFRLQPIQQRKVMTKGLVVATAPSVWESWSPVFPVYLHPRPPFLKTGFCFSERTWGKWPPQPWSCIKTLSSSATNDLDGIPGASFQTPRPKTLLVGLELGEEADWPGLGWVYCSANRMCPRQHRSWGKPD